MKRREKILAAAFLVTIVAWQGQSFVGDLLFKPLRTRQQRLKDIERGIETKKEQEQKLDRAMANRKVWSARSLPPDPLVASALYHNWLIEVATKAKFKNVSVTPGRVETRPKGDTYFSVPFVVNAQANLTRLCDFLDEFRRAGLMHRVVRMTLESPADTGDPELNITLQIEGLSLTSSPRRKTLFAEDKAAVAARIPPARDRKDYAPITEKNLFVRTYPQPKQPDPAVKAQEIANLAERVFLRGTLTHGASSQAWLYDTQTNARIVLNEGAAFSAGGISGTVVSIGPQSVTLQIREESCTLALGKNLTQIVKPETKKTSEK